MEPIMRVSFTQVACGQAEGSGPPGHGGRREAVPEVQPGLREEIHREHGSWWCTVGVTWEVTARRGPTGLSAGGLTGS
ncbi:hypothetical protein Lfu02_77200 [Longispora fulva]|nr:hypothetical protein Lfu02_77200 [Longispora fulva]